MGNGSENLQRPNVQDGKLQAWDDVQNGRTDTSRDKRAAMKKKLTLRMDADVIERAKAYAGERGESVSKLVENYFAALTAPEQANGKDSGDEEPLPPITRRLADRPPAPDIDEEDYYRYLEEKYR